MDAIFDLFTPIVEQIQGRPATTIGLKKATFSEATSIWSFPGAGGGVGTAPVYDRSRIGERFVPTGPRGPTILAGLTTPTGVLAAPVQQRVSVQPVDPGPLGSPDVMAAPTGRRTGGLQVGYTGPPVGGGGGLELSRRWQRF